MIHDALARLLDGRGLSRAEARGVVEEVMRITSEPSSSSYSG